MPSCQLAIRLSPGEVEENAKSTLSVAAVAPAALIIMLIVPTIQLQSFSQLFLVLSVAPFGLIGVVAALPIARKATQLCCDSLQEPCFAAAASAGGPAARGHQASWVCRCRSRRC